MKKIIIIFTICIFVIAAVTCIHSNNPYTGSYECKESSNISLDLKNNKTFLMSVVVGKNSEYMEGTYDIKNNNIKLNFRKDKNNEAEYNLLKGRVVGSEIIFDNINEDFEKL